MDAGIAVAVGVSTGVADGWSGLEVRVAPGVAEGGSGLAVGVIRGTEVVCADGA